MIVKSARNGKIEFLRFAFCIVIMLFHIGDTVLGLSYRLAGNISLFSKGYFGVEFFFVVSGYLMAASAFKNQSNVISLGSDTFNFMQRKVMAILPYHLIVFAITFVGVCILEQYSFMDITKRFLSAIPNLLLISRSGLANTDILGVEWYISDMLIAMLVLYPLCRRYYDKFTKIVAPVLAVMIVGYLIKTTGTLSGSTAWSGLVAKTFLRAVSELCAGVFVFELCRNIKKLNFTKTDRAILTVVELCSYIAVGLFMLMANIQGKFGGQFLIFTCVGVCLSFSGVTYGDSLFNNSFVYFLGSLSLPLYLCHSLTRRIAANCLGDMRSFYKIIVFFVLSFAMAFVLIPVEKGFRKIINKKMNRLGIKL